MAGPAGVAVLGVGAVAWVALVDPNDSGHYPTCPFLEVTGLFCPGCGSLRAVHALTRGDVATAVDLNVLTVLAVLPVLALWASWSRRSWSSRARSWAAPAWVLWALLAVVLAFGVVRNLPVGAALAP